MIDSFDSTSRNINGFLSKSDIEELTGFKQKVKQSEWLIHNGIHHFHDRSGYPKALWSSVSGSEHNHPSQTDAMPDLEALKELDNGS